MVRHQESRLMTPTQARASSPQGEALQSFTLIELLVVIAILAVLAVAVVLILNPVELIKESRDTTRIEDLATLNKALGYLQTDQPNTSFGSSTTVYVSIPWTTTSTNCSNLGLPALPSGYAYGCAPTSTHQMTDGTGWVPLDFTSLSFGSPFSRLPVDPVNTTSSGYYYTYIPGGSWKLTAFFESADRAPEANKDGGTDAALYEVGTSLTTISPGRGLVGHWRFEEGSGTSATDASGSGNTGTMYSSSTLTSLHTSSGKVGSYAGSFDGTSNYIRISDTDTLDLSNVDFSITIWMNPETIDDYDFIIDKESSGFGGWWLEFAPGKIVSLGGSGSRRNILNTAMPLDTWSFLAVTYSESSGLISGYLNSSLDKTISQNLNIGTNTQPIDIGSDLNIQTRWFDGFIDDVRIYNRALSETEIKAIYNATR